jgi:hypothetical protein
MPGGVGGAAVAAVATKDIVGWSVTAFVLIVNLSWNYLNRRHTDQVAREIRERSFDWDEWKAKRAAITTRLEDFDAAVDRVLALSRGDHKAADLKKELMAENRSLISAHEALIRALDRQGGHEWIDLAYGPANPSGETSWDLLNAILGNVASYGSDAKAIRASLMPAADRSNEITRAINVRLKDVTHQHDPRIS